MKQKVEEYEYDEAMEPSYRKSMLKSFVKTLEEGFFPMVVVDAVNHKVRMCWKDLVDLHFIAPPLTLCFRSAILTCFGAMPR